MIPLFYGYWPQSCFPLCLFEEEEEQGEDEEEEEKEEEVFEQ